jgi:endonuclease-3
VRRWKVPAVGVIAEESHSPFQTLVSCVLSLRTRDKTTEAASRRLFAIARTPERMAGLPAPRIEKAIYPVSFYRVKARSIRSLCQDLIERFGGKVPDTIEELLTLQGVGRKTANLVVTVAYRRPGICVDTHVHRISNRWGYVKTRTPEETEEALRRVLPRHYWITFNDLLVTYGQNLCTPLSPFCSRCALAPFCAKTGVTRSR